MNYKKFIITIFIAIIICSNYIIPVIAVPTSGDTTQYVIALDAGHGGAEAGASYAGLKEEVMTEATVSYMKSYFQQYSNITVVDCPKKGGANGGPYSDRPAAAKDNNANVHVTMHYNCGGGQGIETLYKSSSDTQSIALAETVLNSVCQSTGLSKRGIQYRSDLGIISSTDVIGCPSICVEGGFIDSSVDTAVIGTNEGLKKVAAGTVSGILAYLGIEDKGYPDIPDYQGYTGSVSGGSSTAGNIKIVSNEEKFLGLWRNETGKYEKYFNEDGTINSKAVYKKDGKTVSHGKSGYPGAAILQQDQWLFDLLGATKRAQPYLMVMKYLMNVYTDTKKYGDINFETDIATLFTSGNFANSGAAYGDGSVVWNNQISLEDFKAACQNYQVPNGVGNTGTITYQEGWQNVFLPNLDTFYNASVEAGLNPMFTLAVAVHESGFGSSKITRDKCNIFGYRAEDDDAYGKAWDFTNIGGVQRCITHWTKWIAGNYVYDQHYYDPECQPSSESSDATYRYDLIKEKGLDPTTVHGINSLYCTTSSWENAVKQHWTNIFGANSYSSGTGASASAQKVIDAAKSKLGCPYVYGAEGPDSFDCSGLVLWACKQAGVNTPPRTTGDYPSQCSQYEVPLDQIQPGDILWKDSHVGIYLGGDEYIHAPQTGDVVKIASLRNRQSSSYAFTKAYRLW